MTYTLAQLDDPNPVAGIDEARSWAENKKERLELLKRQVEIEKLAILERHPNENLNTEKREGRLWELLAVLLHTHKEFEGRWQRLQSRPRNNQIVGLS